MAKLLLPELGEGIEKAIVACWHVGVGDKVKEGDDIVELVTDKASFNVPAVRAGVMKEKKFKEGQEAKIGDILAIIDVHD